MLIFPNIIQEKSAHFSKTAFPYNLQQLKVIYSSFFLKKYQVNLAEGNFFVTQASDTEETERAVTSRLSNTFKSSPYEDIRRERECVCVTTK